MYATTENLRDRLKSFFDQLYADADADGGVSLEDAANDLEAAEAEVDASAAVRYTVPVTAVAAQAILKSWTLTITEELAWRRSAQGTTPENVKDRVKEVRRQLERMSEGKVVIAAAVESAKSAGGAAIVSCSEPIFTREKMRGF
jgi:phage gp36-like protein